MKDLLNRIRRILRDRRIRRFLTRIVAGVAAVVVFMTTYALVLPAITMESQAKCGMEAHQHDDSCYEEILICDKPESDGHHHDDSCYKISRELTCNQEEHQHSDSCYDEEGNLICELSEHTHDKDCYEENKELVCEIPESEGHHHDASCYKKELTCGKEAHTHSEACYEDDGENAGQESASGDAASSEASVNAGTDSSASENLSGELTDSDNANTADTVLPEQEAMVPELDPLDFRTILNKSTGIYYYKVKPEEKVEDSSQITDWTRAKDKKDSADDCTELASDDLIRVYLSYTIPGGSLNTTNPTARYRLPDSIRLSDNQIKAINKAENGISRQFDDKDKHDDFLGAEAIEGTRRPDQDIDDYLEKNGQEYISATVKAENVHNDSTGEYEGQDLIFTFTPYTVEKNQNVYDAAGEKTNSGEKVRGWFTFDMTTDQVEWGEAAIIRTESKEENENTEVENAEAENAEAENAEAENAETENVEAEKAEAEKAEVENVGDDNAAEEAVTADSRELSTVIERSERTADIEFVVEENDKVETTLKLVEEKEIENTEENQMALSDDDTASDFISGTLETSGDGYKITLDYPAEAQIPENASLSVREITAETDPEAYKACLEQAGNKIASDDSDNAGGKRSTINENASRFFDIEIVVNETDENGQETSRKIEPKAEVFVNIQMTDAAAKASGDSAENTDGNSNESNSASQGSKEPTVLHFTDDGVEKLQSTVVDEKNAASSGEGTDHERKGSDSAKSSDGNSASTEIQFTTDSFSIYGVVYSMHTYVISANGETYEIIVTYDDSAEIPEDAELQVREIKNTEEKYTKNVEATNKELIAQEAPEVGNPVQFEISIISDGVEVEPKEGSTVKVEIRLVPKVFDKQTEDSEDNESSAVDSVETETEDNVKDEAEKGEIWFNGEKISAAEEDENTRYTVSHITDDGNAEIIEDVSCTVNDEETIVLQFETESFSDYLFDESTDNTLWKLPDIIYVGDEIYMYNRADYWVSNIGTVVSETKHPNGNYGNDGSKWKTVTAKSPGTFRIYNRYNQYGEYKEITVQAARTGTQVPGTIDTVDNASIGLTLNLFDYDLDGYLDDYFNNFDHGDNPVSAEFLNRLGSINDGHALKFWGSGIGNNYGSANQFDANLVKSIVQKNLVGGIGGYPQLTANSNPGRSTESLEYLFSPSNGTDKEAYTNVNHLFKKQGDYFVYDSNENYAYYDKSQEDGGNFVVYERTYEQKSRKQGGEQAQDTNDKSIGFFPFHKWDEYYDQYTNWNKTLNHHFGLSMSVPFSMPKAPKAVEDTNGQPIIFEFSGDDDLWVFIDGKLAMDIGGIHQPTSGTINFTDKTVTVNNQSQSFDFSNLYDGNKHILQVFYLERGGADSNCKIMFNMTQYGDVEFDKVDHDNNSVLLPGAVFGLYKDEDCTEPLMEKLDPSHGGTSRSFTVETDENGHAKLEDVPLGDYYLKEIHAPDGYPITIGDEAAHVHVYLDASGDVKVSINEVGTETGVKITNKKPSPINVGVKKEWQDEDGQTIPAPDGVTASFEIKRMRTYEIHKEEKIEGEERQSSHLTVGWLHNGQPYEYEEFDLVAGSNVTVSWSYVDGYEGAVGYRLNGTDYTKPTVPTNIYSQAFNMPAAGQNAVFYIVDNSENGEAISNINVAGSQFYGNSGGGYIHKFRQITEPDTGFTYTGSNVTNNTVTLPIDEIKWQYIFNNLPIFGNGTVRAAIEEGDQEEDYDVAFQYSYYLEEVNNTAPEGTTVIYKDFDGNEIQSPTDAETSTSGTETIINRVPFGYLKIEKAVTYNGSSENLTAGQKSKLAGTYKFKIYTKETCGAADAVQDPNAAEDAQDKDLIITIIIGEDGQAVSSNPIKLVAGNYWIKEVESSNPSMFPVENPIAVTVTKDNISTNPVIKSLTNNYDENNGPDKISLDIEKVFTGLDLSSQVPPNFQVKLHYTVNGQPKEVTLHNTELATGENGEKIVWTQSTDGLTWHWKVSNIPSEAKNFEIKEVNYNKAKGYDWISASLNNVDITDTVTEWHDLSVTAPAATLTDVTNDRRTSDSGSNTVFYLDDSDILLSKLTANQGTLVISKHPLNLAERDAVVKGWPSQGGFKTPPHFFSIDEHPNGFAYGDKTVTFGEKNGRTTVKFTQNASAQEDVFAVSYDSEEARNNANLENTYEEVPITIDIIKVDEENNSKKLPGAIFTLRQIADQAPTDNGTLQTQDGTTPIDSAPTDGNGKTSFSNLTHGYYEISEKQSPLGYVLSEDTTFYFKIESGEVKWLVKGTNKPSEWAEKEEKAEGESVDFEPAHAAIEADPENNIEAQSATNAAFTVENTPGAALPSTGGSGTRLFTIFGTILALSSVVLLFRRHKIV